MKYLKRFNENKEEFLNDIERTNNLYKKVISKDSDIKYFVCHRIRNSIDLAYVKEFLKNERGWNKITIYDNYQDAREELDAGFYDDSDYAVVKIENDKFYIMRGRDWQELK